MSKPQPNLNTTVGFYTKMIFFRQKKMYFEQFKPKFLSVVTQVKMHLRMEFGSGVGPTIHTASTNIPDTLQYDQREIISISGFILQSGTCKIFSLAENPRWSWVWQQQKIIKWTIKLETSKPQVPTPIVELCIINSIIYSNNILSSHLYNIDAFLGFLL